MVSVSKNLEFQFNSLNLLDNVYCDDNPMRYIDPNGMEIAEGSQAKWVRRQTEIEDQRKRLLQQLNKQKDKDPNSSRVSSLQARINGIGSTLKTMGDIAKSSQMYALKNTTSNLGGLTLNDETITITYNGTSNFVHEVTHAGQFESGDVAFDFDTGKSFGQDINDELSAYKAQFSYSPSSTGVNNIKKINQTWLYNIRLNNEPIYIPGGIANTGIISINTNSTVRDMQKAYPADARELKSLSPDLKLKSFTNIFYKK